MSFPRVVPLLALCLSTLLTSSVNAEEAKAADTKAPTAPPENRLYLAQLDIIRVGPIGLESQNRLVFQHRLMDSESVLFRDTYANGALNFKLNPAYFKVGPMVDIQPIALFNLRLAYEYMQYFGGFGFLQSFPEPTTDYSFEATVRDENEEAGLNYVTTGSHIFVEPTLQLKVKKVAVRSKLAIERWKMNLQNGDKVFYDATLHTLVPGDGMVLANDTDVLYVTGKKLTAGIRYSGVFPQYAADDFQSGTIPDNAMDGSHHKLGPLVAYSFNTREFTRWNKPTLLVVGGWYLKHPNEVESKVPYVLVGFGFNSDFLHPRD